MDTGQLNLQLVELLSRISDAADAAEQAVRTAVWTGDALDAEVAVVLRDGAVLAGTGVRRDDAGVVARLLGAVEGTPLDLPGVPRAHVARAPVRAGDGSDTVLLVARAEEGFDAAERLLLVGTGRLLGQALQSSRALTAEREQRRRGEDLAAEREELLGTLREREVLLRVLLELQRAISRRRPLEEVLDLAGDGALRVLGGDEAAVVLEDPLHPEQLQVRARRGHGGTSPCGEVVEHARAAVAAAVETSGAHDRCRWRAAPARSAGRLVGALVLVETVVAEGARGPVADGPAAHPDLLTTFTDHVGSALDDSRTAATLRESYYDQLTRLPNRALFLDRLEQARAGSAGGRGLALLFVDLDGFKAVNDRFGHEAGDAVLAVTAQRLRADLRPDDTAARLGGDEFAVVLHDVDVTAARFVAERLATRLREPVVHDGHVLPTGASVGVAVVGHEGTTRQSLLRDADTAMYAVKAGAAAARGAGVRVFEAALQTARAERLELETDLARALAAGRDEDELVLHYQPVVRLADGQPLGLEALVRWQHPRRGLLAPAAFLPVAEQAGLQAALDGWVLARACAQLGRWRRRGLAAAVAVNVSAAQLGPRLVEEVRAALRRDDLPGSALTLEVTETVLVSEGATAAAVLTALRGHGVRVAVDDFGTGYSSLSYLQRLPVDVLKVDRSFVTALGRGEDPALVRTVLGLACALGLTAVAEGIETEQEAAVLRDLGCPEGQGYLFARPLAADAVEDWWARRAVAAPLPHVSA